MLKVMLFILGRLWGKSSGTCYHSFIWPKLFLLAQIYAEVTAGQTPRHHHLYFQNQTNTHTHTHTMPCNTHTFCEEIWIILKNTFTYSEKCFSWLIILKFQFSSVSQLCPTLCNPMNHSMPDLLVHLQLPESTQTHVHCVGDAIQPSHPLSSPSPPAPNLSQHPGLFQ